MPMMLVRTLASMLIAGTMFLGAPAGAQSVVPAIIEVHQANTGEVLLTANATMSCGSYPDGAFSTSLTRNVGDIEVLTPMINLGCAPPGSGSPPGSWSFQLVENAGVLDDGVYNVIWRFRFRDGLEFQATKSFQIVNGALPGRHAVPASGVVSLLLLAMLVIAAAHVARPRIAA